MKKFEHKTKDERRRVLLEKNVTKHSYSIKNRTEVLSYESTRTSGGAIAKLRTTNIRFIAFAVVLALLVTLIPIAVLAAGETEPIRYSDSHVVDIDGLHLNKTVTQDPTNPDKYHIALEALAEEDSIEQPITDIVMTMDLSSRMGLNLYTRDYKNLNTHSTFSTVSLRSVAHNSMFDQANPHNNGIAGVEIGLLNPYEGKKYIEDPNNPGTYVYMSTTWRNRITFSGGYENLYTYSFTDSNGNVYTSPEYNGGLLNSVFSPINSISFSTNSTDPSVLVPSFSISEFYQRSDDNSLNSTLISYAGTPVRSGPTWTRQDNRTLGTGRINYSRVETATYNDSSLFIVSDDGVKVPVTIVVKRNASYYETYVAGARISTSDFSYENLTYTYYCTIDGKTYSAVQGNEVYGADYGVFQGFKDYTTDEHGNLVVDHENSIESKSLYTSSQNETVTRLQAMKEAAEKFIIQIHQDAFAKNPDLSRANVRLGVITYGDGATAQYNLPDINLSNEVEVNKAIDKIYSLSSSNRPASELDYAMNAVQNQFTTYSVEGTTADNDGGKENKKISVLFSSGVPTRKSSNIFGNPRNSEYYFNETVANNAIGTASNMKNNLGVMSYTVGLFNGASTASRALYGEKFDYTLHVDPLCDGKVGSVWGETSFTYLLNGWVHNVDVPATNRVMNYISSNFSDADGLGLTWKTGLNPGRYILTLGGSGWQITNNYNASSEGYYFAIPISEDVDYDDTLDQEMAGIFNQIASAIEIPSSTLGAEDQLIDYVTEYFDIVNGTVSAHTETPADRTNYESTTWTSNHDEAYFSNKITIDDKKISVEGFDYQSHSMTKPEAQKLVLEFDVTRKEGLIGGNSVPTNTSLSGVYDIVYDETTGDLTNTLLEEAFQLPTVDLDIIIDTVTNDASVYYGSAQNLKELVTTDNIDGFNNTFVDITFDIYDGNTLVNSYAVPAGQSEGTWANQITADEGGGNVQNLDKVYPQMTETTEYRIVCTVDPTIIPGTLTDTVSVKDENDQDPTSTVYVFNPHVEVHNDELSEPGEYNLTTIPDLVSWNSKDTDGEPLTGAELTHARGMLPAEVPPAALVIETVDSTKPAVTGSNETAYQIDETMDFVVSKIKVVPATFTYESWEHISHEEQDEGGQTVIIDDGYDWVSHTINGDAQNLDWPAEDATYANGGATFNNTSDGRENGQFTISVGKHFDIVLDKWFTGDYANLQEITIIVTPLGDNDVPDTAHAHSRTFTEAEFDRSTYKASSTKRIEGLDANRSYIISEDFAADAGNPNEPEKAKYTILFSVTDNNQSVSDADNDDGNNQFKLVKGNTETAVTIRVTNDAVAPTIEGVSAESNANHVILIALSGIGILSVGAGAYYLYRKKDEFM